MAVASAAEKKGGLDKTGLGMAYLIGKQQHLTVGGALDICNQRD